MTSKVIITADWHIGAKMASAGSAAMAFANVKFNTLKQIMDATKINEVDAVFILGDIFDNDSIGEEDIIRTKTILTRTQCPVYIIPGNHDWWHKGGSLYTFKKKCEDSPQIHFITENTPLNVDGINGVTFYMSPVNRRNPLNDPSEWIPERKKGDGLRIGMLHGALDSVPDGTIPANVTNLRELDYTFLGDWHRPHEPFEKTRYCGSPEPLGFDEDHRGQYLLVELDKKNITIEDVTVGLLSWKRIETTLTSESDGGTGCAPIKEFIESIDTERNDTAIRMHLSGSLSWEEQKKLDDILHEVSLQGWAFVDTKDVNITVSTEPNLDELPESLKEVARKVLASGEKEVVKRRALKILIEKAEVVT